MKIPIPRPMVTKLSTLAVAAGLTLSLLMGLASNTRALPKDSGRSNANNCTYAGQPSSLWAMARSTSATTAIGTRPG